MIVRLWPHFKAAPMILRITQIDFWSVGVGPPRIFWVKPNFYVAYKSNARLGDYHFRTEVVRTRWDTELYIYWMLHLLNFTILPPDVRTIWKWKKNVHSGCNLYMYSFGFKIYIYQQLTKVNCNKRYYVVNMLIVI